MKSQCGSLLGMGEDGLEEALRPPPSSQGQRSTPVLHDSVLFKFMIGNRKRK